MQIKKDMWLSFALIIIAGWLLIAGRQRTPTPQKLHAPAQKVCCKNPKAFKPFSPWNFVTEGILHFSA